MEIHDDHDTPEERWLAQFEAVVNKRHLSAEELDCMRAGVWKCWLDERMTAMVVELRAYVCSQLLEDVTIEYPRDWWQALKQRWFAAWMLQRWPVVMKTHQIVAKRLFPNFPMPPDDRRFDPMVMQVKHTEGYREVEQTDAE